MNPQRLQDYAIRPALTLLPPRMDSRPAVVFLVAIALQESALTYRHQINGPAHSWWQFERLGGVRGVMTHRSSRGHVHALLDVFGYRVRSYRRVHDAMEHNDILAAGMARLLLWTLPVRLPTTASAAWAQYLDAWRPGRPHRRTWGGYWAQAEQSVPADDPGALAA